MYFDVSSHRNCSSRAGGEAGSAGDTLVLAVHQLWCTHLGFRIGAPQATQRTALHEHVRAYAGAIVDAEVLDVEDCAFVASSASANFISVPILILSLRIFLLLSFVFLMFHSLFPYSQYSLIFVLFCFCFRLCLLCFHFACVLVF